MTTKHANSQPANDSKNSADQQGIEIGQEQIPNVFALSDFSQPSSQQILQLQRTIGNARTKQLLSRRIQRSPSRSLIQRADGPQDLGGVKTGGSFDTKGAKITREQTVLKWKKTTRYVVFEVEASVGGDIGVTWSKDKSTVGVESKEMNDATIKAKTEVWKSKTAHTTEEKDELWEMIQDHFEAKDASIEWDILKTSHKVDPLKEKDESKTTMGAAIVFSTSAGDKHKLFFNVFEATVTPDKSSITPLQAGLQSQISFLPKAWTKMALAEGAEITGNLLATVKFTATPNWAGVIEKAAERAAVPVASRALGAIGEFAGLPLMFVAGGYETLKGYYEFIQEMAELKALRASVNPSINGYVAGFMAGIGATGSYGSGDSGWLGYGTQRGQAAMGKGLAAMRKRLDEVASGYGINSADITDEMLQAKMKEVIAAQAQSIHDQLYNSVATPIKVMLYKKFKQTHPDEKDWAILGFAELQNYVGKTNELPDPFKQTEVKPDEGGAAAPAPAPVAPKNYTPSPQKAPQAPASAQEASQQDATPIPQANNISGRSDTEQADAEETDRQAREKYEREHPNG